MSACLTVDPHAAMMVAFQAGDAGSFDLLLEEYRGMIIGYLYRFVRDRAVAEELAQEVFLRVCSVRNYEPTAKFRTWLFRIATNLAINWVRDQRAESAVLRLDDRTLPVRPYELRSRGPSIEDRLVARSTRDEVHSAVDALPERHRAAVLMHKYMEMEYREIAGVLNCSVPALKSLLFRSYEILRRQLAHLDPAA
jgi:RNA polymerase sigma-70 factor, ECF subfamily